MCGFTFGKLFGKRVDVYCFSCWCLKSVISSICICINVYVYVYKEFYVPNMLLYKFIHMLQKGKRKKEIV